MVGMPLAVSSFACLACLLTIWFVSAEAPKDRWVRYLVRLLLFPILQMAGATLVRISTATSMAKVGNAQAKRKLALSTLFAYQSFMTLFARTMLMSMGSVQDVIIATVIAGVQEFIARSSIVLVDNAVNKHVYRRAFDRKLREEQLEVWAADISGSMAIEHTAILLMGVVELLFLEHVSVINVGGYELTEALIGNSTNATPVFATNATAAAAQCLMSSSLSSAAVAGASSSAASETSRVAAKIFVQFFVEIAVDAFSGTLEVTQGIPIARYWQKMGGLEILEMAMFINFGAMAVVRLVVNIDGSK